MVVTAVKLSTSISGITEIVSNTTKRFEGVSSIAYSEVSNVMCYVITQTNDVTNLPVDEWIISVRKG